MIDDWAFAGPMVALGLHAGKPTGLEAGQPSVARVRNRDSRVSEASASSLRLLI